MPNKIKMKKMEPRDQEEFKIPIDPRTGEKADWVGIHRGRQERGRQEIGFFVTIRQESITAGVRTNRGWKYYPIPEGAYYVLFNVTPDGHPSVEVSDKIISIAEFRDADNQKIVASRVETK